MTTEATQTVADLTIAELVALLRKTVTASLAEIVGCTSDQQEPCQGLGPETESDDRESVYSPADSHLPADTDGTVVSPKMAQKVSDLPVADFQWWVHYIVGEVGEDLIGDPDEGLELSDWAVARLEKAEAEIAAGERHTIPLEEVARRHGLSL